MKYANLMPDKKVGDYVWNQKALLGTGQFGKVYLGHLEKNKDRMFAIKVIQNSSVSSKYMQKALNNEIELLKKLNGKSTIGLIDYLQTANNKYLIQPFCDGGDLRQYLTDKEKLTEAEAIVKFKQILDGIKELYDLNHVHRDLKPENILLDQNRCRIADFGFSRQVDDQNMLRTVCGTPLYMSPQLLKNEKYTSKSDIWSLGLIFYEMLYGKTPWSVKTQYELIQKCTTQKIRFPINVKVSDISKQLINRCLEVNENKRIDWKELFDYQLSQDMKIKDLKADDQEQMQQLQKQNTYQKAEVLMGEMKYNQSQEIDDSCKKIILVLQQAVDNDVNILQQIFNKFDSSNDQQLQIEEFSKICRRLDSTLSKQQIQQLFALFDIDKDESVSYNEFYKVLIENDYKQNDENMVLIQYRANALIKKLKKIIEQNGIQIVCLFKELDTSKNNLLDRQELLKLLKMIDPEISQKHSNYIFDTYDYDRSGELSLVEFQKMLDCKEDEQQQRHYGEAVKKLKNKVKDVIFNNNMSLQQFFEHHSQTKSDKMDRQNFFQFIISITDEFSKETIEGLYNLFDVLNNGTITSQQFVEVIQKN